MQILSSSLIGHLVAYRLNGVTVLWGRAEYLTADGWVGVRQVGGRLDECPADLVVADAS